jgi:hypothetical protein
MKDFKEPKAIHIKPKQINIPTNVCDVSKFTFISPDNGRKYGYDSNGTPCISKPIQNPINVSYIPPKESSSITYVSPYSSFTPQDSSFIPKHNIFSPQGHNINISNRQEVSQSYEAQKAQKTKEINESWKRQKAVEAEKLEVINTALKLKAIQEFEASDIGKATRLLQEAEEIYAKKVKHLENIKKNIFYEKNKALATQQVEQAAKQVETFKAIKVKAEKDALDKLWYERENEKMYEQYAKEKLEQEKAEIVKVAERMRLNSQEDQEFLTEKNARIDHTKKKLYEIELNPSKHNTPEVEKYSPLIIKTLMQYSRDYDGFNKQIISDTIPIQALHTLSLKKTDLVDSHAVDLVFDLLRDNQLPSLKTLDLSDNPKSIGADQIGKLADSFFSGNNNLETLDISCVYPPTTDLRAPFKASGERLVGDAHAGDYPLGHKLFELYCSVSTCKQPLSITLESAVSYPLDSSTIPTFDALHIPYVLITHYIDWMGEPASFKTTSIDMVNHTRQILEKMIEIRDEQSLRTGSYEALIKYQGDKVPHVVETFKWGVTKCLAPKTLNKVDFEWVKDSLIDSPHDYHNLARIMQITQTKLDVFVCVTEVMDDRIITHDMINHKAEWQDAFPSGHFNKRYTKGGKEHITKDSTLTGKGNTQSFDSGCKHCEESQFNYFLNTQYILQKNDVTTMTKLDLSHSSMDDGDAKILAELIRQGNLPNLKGLDVSGNQITDNGEGYFAKAMQNSTVQHMYVTLKNVVGTKKDYYGPILKQVLKDAKANGVDTSNIVVDKSLIGSIKDNLTMGKKIVFSFIKCKLVPEIEAPSLAKDLFVFTYPKHMVTKILNPIDTLTCVFEGAQESFNSDLGAKIAVRDLELMGMDDFIHTLE